MDERRKTTDKAKTPPGRPKPSLHRGGSAFDHTPVPLWELDFSAVRLFLKRLRRTGVTDFRAHFASTPADLSRCAAGVKIVAANRAGLEFFGVSNRRQLTAILPGRLTPGYGAVLAEALAELAGGAPRFTGQMPVLDAAGRTRNVELRLKPVPDRSAPWKRVLAAFNDITARLETEAALRRSEEQLSGALRIARLGHWELDLARLVFTFSDEFYSLLRTSAAEMGGHEMAADQYAERFLFPEDRDRVRLETEKALLSDDPDYYGFLEHRVRFGDGSTGHIAVNIKVKRDPRGKPLKTYGVNQDVTERKQAEEALRRSEEQYRLINDSSRELVYSYDRSGRFTSASLSLCRAMGRPAEQIIGRTHAELGFPPEPCREWEALHARVFATDSTVVSETSTPMPDGDFHHFEVVLNPMHDAAGAIVGISGTTRDITERKRAEEALRQSEARYRLIAEHTSDSIWVMGPDLRFTYLSPSTERLFGYTVAEWKALDWGAFVDPDHLGTVTRLFQALQQEPGKGSRTAAVRVRHRQGREMWVEFTASPVQGPAGQLASVVGVTRDITRRKRDEQALEELRLRNEAILGSVPDIIMEVDTRKRYTWANEAGKAFFGADVVGREAADYFVGEQNTYQSVSPLFSGSQDLVYVESWQRRCDGQERLLSWLCRTLRNLAGEVTGALSSARDVTDLMRTSIALQESEEKLRSLFDTMSQGVVYQMADGRIVDANPAAGEILGLSRDQLLGRTSIDPRWHAVREDMTPFPGDQHPAMVALRTGKPVANVVMGVGLPDRQTYRWILVSATPQFRPNREKPFQVFTSFTDITERKRAEERLAHSHHLMRYIIEHNRSAVAVHDRELRYLYVSQRYLDEYNVKEKEVIGRHHYDVFPDLPQKWREVHRRVLEGEVLSAEDDPYLRADGSVEWTRWECRPWTEPDGSIGGLIVYTEVITPRKRAEEALRDSEARFRSIAEQSSDLISITDANGLIRYASPASQRMFGVPPEEMVGRPFIEFLDPASVAPAMAAFRETQMQGRPAINLELKMKRRDGSRFLGELNGSLRAEAGMLGTLVVIRDITDRVRMEAERIRHAEQLMQADKMATLGILVAGVAHEINNPNNFIMMNADIIHRAWGDIRPVLERHEREHGSLQVAGLPFRDLGDRFMALVDGIREGTQRIQAIVADLREYAVPDTSDLSHPIEVNKVLESAVHLTRNLIQKSTHRFGLDLAPGLPALIGSAQKLEQVFINLLQNACQALSDPRQAIEVQSRFDGSAGRVVVTVHDQGGGISADDLKHIADPFFTTRQKSGGTGLGLSISQRIVRDHGGTMTFASEVGRGTTVTVSLPAVGNGTRPGE